MNNFKFRLQCVLDQRERQEKAAQLSFAEASTACRRADELLLELYDVRQALITELGGCRDRGFDAVETQLYQDYMQTISTGIKDQEAHLSDLTTTREAFKLHMLGATQGRQVIDKVKSRARDVHTREREVEAQKVADDLTSTRYVAKQRAQEQKT
jgi:flagellar export protein FliJ